MSKRNSNPTEHVIPAPNEIHRARRPERFSDTVRQDTPILERPVLEHQIATLNRRGLELAFENFAKQICEKIVCPNLIAQTGPVAGGDGKTDTQTFTVSEQTKLLWYEGVNASSHKERWAFAVSTQKDWRAKCRSDARKISKTERDYTNVFFVTNQFAKASLRSELEDSLQAELGLRVEVFDISWLLDQTLKNGLESLAIETLSIGVKWSQTVKLGPND